MTTKHPLKFASWQDEIVAQARRAIEQTLRNLAHDFRPGDRRTRSERLDGLKTPRVGNVVGLFGARGSGKTTTAIEVIKRLPGECPKSPDRVEVTDAPAWLMLRMPLDLSQMPADTPQGLAVLEWVHHGLVLKHGPRPSDDPRDEHFERVRRAFVLRTRESANVAQAVAIGLDDFARRWSDRLDHQMNLPDLVYAWLQWELKESGYAGVLVFVDDADLCRADGQESLVWSLLDELHQAQLAIVLLGDMARLEKNVNERLVRTHDNHTAAELWDKAVPESLRVMLRPWTPSQRNEFSQMLDDQHTFTARVKDLGSTALPRLLPYVLPPTPRGLREVHEVLRPGPDTKLNVHDLLPRLTRIAAGATLTNATALGHARWLERAVWDRLDHKGMPRDHANLWRRMTYDASVGAAGDDAPIRELIPDNPEDLGLTDLSEAQRSRWTETFIDLELERPAMGALTGRRLINAHATLRWISQRLTPTVEISGSRAAAYLEHGKATTTYELMWMRWVRPSVSESPTVGYRLGLRSLLSYLGGRRNLLDASVSEYLMVPANGRRRTTPIDHVLPRSVRDIIRFLSALNVTDWSALAGSRYLRSPGAMARLAAGLVWVSYWRALERLGELPSIPDAWNQHLSDWDDERIDAEFHKLRGLRPLERNALTNGDRSGPLFDAWDAFRNHESFLGLDRAWSGHSP